MAAPSFEPSSSHTHRLNEILAQIVEAERAGQAPVLEEVQHRHPEFSDEIKSFFAERETLPQWDSSANIISFPATDADPDDSPAGPPPEEEDTAEREPSHKVFGDYELLEEIARGGMGVIYKARQVELNRIVALKMILAGNLADEEDERRFRREAEAAANLDHPNIVPIYEIGDIDDQKYFTMKLVEGGNLAEVLAQKSALCNQRNQRRVARLMRKVALAVHHAHSRGILHRDLKPSNILLDADGEPLVTDFGLAKIIHGGRLDSSDRITHSNVILGTPSYIPPEQASGKRNEISAATDVYSLGAILYELLTGQPPFRAKTPLNTVFQVIENTPERPRRIQPEIDRDLETITLKCLEKEVQRRYASAQDFANDLKCWLMGKPIAARPVTKPELVWRWCKRNPAVTSLSISLIVVALVAVLGLVRLWTMPAPSGSPGNSAAENLDSTPEIDFELVRQREENARTSILQAATARYAFQLTLARKEIQENNFKPALTQLNKCVRRMRSWEHHFLKNLCLRKLSVLQSIRRIPPNPIPKEFTRFLCSPDGRFVVLATGGNSPPTNASACRIELRSIQTGQALLKSKIAPPYAYEPLGFTPDSKLLVMRRAEFAADGSAKRIDLSFFNMPSGIEAHSIDDIGFRAAHLAFNKSGRFLAAAGTTVNKSGGAEQRIAVWDRREGKTLFSDSAPRQQRPPVFDICPDGRYLALLRASGGVGIVDVALGRRSATLARVAGIVQNVVFSPDRRTMMTVNSDKVMRIWNRETGRLRRSIKSASFISQTAFSRDGRRIAALHTDRGKHSSITIWDVATGQLLMPPLKVDVQVTHLSFSPNGQFLTAGGSGGVHILDSLTGSATTVVH